MKRNLLLLSFVLLPQLLLAAMIESVYALRHFRREAEKTKSPSNEIRPGCGPRFFFPGCTTASASQVQLNEECAICLQNVTPNDMVNCCHNRHKLHLPCYFSIFNSEHCRCPFCREEFISKPAHMQQEMYHLLLSLESAEGFALQSSYIRGLLILSNINSQLEWIQKAAAETIDAVELIKQANVKLLSFFVSTGLVRHTPNSPILKNLLLHAMIQAFKNPESEDSDKIIKLLLSTHQFNLNEPVDIFSIQPLNDFLASNNVPRLVNRRMRATFAHLAVVLKSISVFEAAVQILSDVDEQRQLLFFILRQPDSASFLHLLLYYCEDIDLKAAGGTIEAGLTPLQVAVVSGNLQYFCTILERIGYFINRAARYEFLRRLEARDEALKDQIFNYVRYNEDWNVWSWFDIFV